MKRVLILAAAAAAVASPALAADCEIATAAQVQAALGSAPLEAGLANSLKALLAQPRYYEDPKQGAVCAQPALDHPLYPGIPVKECSYQRASLTGWVMVANPGPDLAAKWVARACGDTADAKTCAVRLTAQAWCASQFSFPVVGNLIQSTPTGPANTVFLHGVPIARPQWMAEKTPVPIDVQKQRLAPLAASDSAYKGLAGAAAWPVGLSSAAYAKYGPPAAKSAPQPTANACPAFARRPDWLNAARATYNQAWRNAQNPLFNVAAKAIMAGDNISGAGCG